MTDFVEYVRFNVPKEILDPHSPNQGKWNIQSKELHLFSNGHSGAYMACVYLNKNGKPTFFNEPDGGELVYFDNRWDAAEMLYKYLEKESIATAVQNNRVQSRPLFDD